MATSETTGLVGRHIGLSYESSANLFYRDLAEGVREAAAARGVSVTVRECGKSIDRQLADVSDLLSEGVDVLMISPVDARAIGAGILRTQEHGVPVFTVDRAALDCQVVCHVTSDNLLGGRLAADFLADALGYRGEVAIVGEILGVHRDEEVASLWAGTSIDERIRGFKEALGRHGGLRLVGEVSGGSDRQRSCEVTCELLREHPAIAGIFAVNDVMAQGVLDALGVLGREDNVVVVGYDATPQACAAMIRGGPLRGDIAQFPARIGHTAVELWGSYVQGMAVPQRVDILVELVTPDNVQRFSGAERLLHVRRGEVWTAGERVVFFPVRGYQMMLNEIHAASPDLLRHIVYRSGLALGRNIADQVRALYPDPRDRLFVLLEDLARGGFGTFELHELDLERGQAVVRGQNLFEASISPDLAWARTPRCVDLYCSGRLAGYLASILQSPAACEEILCEARGDSYCEFAISAMDSASAHSTVGPR